MAEETVVVRYRAEVDEATRKLQLFAEENANLAGSSNKAEQATENLIASIKKGFRETGKVATISSADVKKTGLSFDQLNKKIKDALDPKPVDNFNKKLTESGKKAQELGKKTDGTFSKLGGTVKTFALGAATALGATFSIGIITKFASASIDAFLEAEKAAERLRFAIVGIGGESEQVFDRLIRQSKEVEKISIFGGKQIQEAQATLAAFGLTGRQIEVLIPKLADFATVIGVDIPQAAQKIGGALQGNGREFKNFGIEVSATQTPLENLEGIMQGFEGQAGAAEAATKTLSGQLAQLKNRSGDLQESIGEKLAPSFVKLKVAVFEATLSLLNYGRVRSKTIADQQSTGSIQANKVIAQLQAEKKTTEEQLIILEKLAKERQKEADVIELNRQLRVRSSDFSARLSVKESDDIKEKIALIDGETQAYRDQIVLLKAAQEEQKRTLTAEGLRLKSAEELNQLLVENKAINDVIAQSNVDLINNELEARKKLSEAARRLAEELRKLRIEEIREIGALRDEELKALKERDDAFFKSIEDRKKKIQELSDLQRRAQEALTAQFLEESSTLPLQERQAIGDSFKVELERDANAEIAKLNNEALTADFDRREEIAAQIVLINSETAQKIKDIYAALGIDLSKIVESDLQIWLDKNAQIINTSQQLLSELNNIYSIYTNARIDDVNREKDARLKSLDEQLKANDEDLSKRRISENEALINEKKIIAEKVKAEEAADKKIREAKRKAAIIDKAAALISIAINTAISISKAAAETGVGAVALTPLLYALGAAQAAAVLAQPIPYKKGTKKARGGPSLVDEEGKEAIGRTKAGRLTHLERGDKVVPMKQTNRYSEVLDSMFDNRFDDYVIRNYVNPALVKERQKRKQTEKESFATQITNALTIDKTSPTPSSLNYFDMENIRKKGVRVTNIDELAEVMSRINNRSIYR